jgi:hypothetical protein
MVSAECAVSGPIFVGHGGGVESAACLGAGRPMLYKTLSAAVYGIDASIIEVEVDVSGIKTNEDHFHTVGLPDAAVRESRDRVRAALKNCGYDIPSTHITINLAPADIRKEGSGFDLPMALGILGAYGGLNKKEVPDCLFVGELSLDGGSGVCAALCPSLLKRSRKEDLPPDRAGAECPRGRHGRRGRSLSGEIAAGCNPLREYRKRNSAAEGG